MIAALKIFEGTSSRGLYLPFHRNQRLIANSISHFERRSLGYRYYVSYLPRVDKLLCTQYYSTHCQPKYSTHSLLISSPPMPTTFSSFIFDLSSPPSIRYYGSSLWDVFKSSDRPLKDDSIQQPRVDSHQKAKPYQVHRNKRPSSRIKTYDTFNNISKAPSKASIRQPNLVNDDPKPKKKRIKTKPTVSQDGKVGKSKLKQSTSYIPPFLRQISKSTKLGLIPHCKSKPWIRSRELGQKRDIKTPKVTSRPFQEDKLPLSRIRSDASFIQTLPTFITPSFIERVVNIKNPILRHFTYDSKQGNLNHGSVRQNVLKLQKEISFINQDLAHYKEHNDQIQYLESPLKGTLDADKKVSDILKSTLIPKDLASNKNLLLPSVIIEGLDDELVRIFSSQLVGIHPKNSADSYQIQRAKLLAEQLKTTFYKTARLTNHCQIVLVVGSQGLYLRHVNDTPDGSRGMVQASFLTGSMEYRRKYGLEKNAPIMRAMRIPKIPISQTRILDATGGLGTDAFILACAGFHVTVLERHPLVYTLLYDAWRTANQIPQLSDTMSRLHIFHADSLNYFPSLPLNELPDIVYLDPMYPKRFKMKSLPKKGMSITRTLTGREDNTQDLLDMARKYAKNRVVLKRPYYVAESSGTTMCYRSRSLRFEVFSTQGPNEFVGTEQNATLLQADALQEVEGGESPSY